MVASSFALGLASACGAPCVDDGLHAKQTGAACLAQTTTSGESTTTTTTTSKQDTTSTGVTTTGDTSSGETTMALTSAPDTSTTASSSETTTSETTTTGDSSGGSSGVDLQEACDDDVQDPGETGVSCGGVCLMFGPQYQCDNSEGCALDGDCKSGHCHKTGTCVELLCDNDSFDEGFEFHIDCGLNCPGCGLAIPCDDQDPNACLIGVCIMGQCALDPTCNDDEGPIGDETDVDCGGPLCGPSCKHEQQCEVPGDCIANSCVDGVCDDLHCKNNVRDGGETDIDCGGPCAPCANSLICHADPDCGFSGCFGGICGG